MNVSFTYSKFYKSNKGWQLLLPFCSKAKTISLRKNLRWQGGDKFIAREFGAGRFHFGGITLDCSGRSVFSVESPSKEFDQELHSFHWLSSLRSTGREIDKILARDLISQWCTHNRRNLYYPSEINLEADRLYYCSVHAPFLLSGAGRHFIEQFSNLVISHFKALFLSSIFFRHYSVLRSLSSAVEAFREFDNFGAYIKSEFELASSLKAKDGIPDSRNPSDIVETIIDLPSYSWKPFLKSLQFFTMSDGGLAAFHGMNVPEREFGKVNLEEASLDGFGRIARGETTIIIDAKAFFAVEISSGNFRLVTQCGGPKSRDDKYSKLALCHQAHSAPCIGEKSVNGQLYSVVNVDGTHEGCLEARAKNFIRKIILSKDGKSILGSDQVLFREDSEKAILRFHLDPEAVVEMAKDDGKIFVAHGVQIWMFSCPNYLVSTEESISFLGRHNPKKTTQIVVDFSEANQEEPVNWAFHRLA